MVGHLPKHLFIFVFCQFEILLYQENSVASRFSFLQGNVFQWAMVFYQGVERLSVIRKLNSETIALFRRFYPDKAGVVIGTASTSSRICSYHFMSAS